MGLPASPGIVGLVELEPIGHSTTMLRPANRVALGGEMRQIGAERAALAFAQRLGEITSHVLGESLLSVILHGSLTFDDYVPGQSDIDVLAIVDQPLSDSGLELLTAAVTAERVRAPAPADLRFVTRAVASAPG